LSVFGKYFFIPKTQYYTAETAATAPVVSTSLAFDVYFLQDLVNEENPTVQIQVNPGGGAANGKVICKLEEKKGRYVFVGVAPFPVIGRHPRTIMDLDADPEVAYEDSLLSTFVTAPLGDIPTKLSKILIHKIIESTNAAYVNLKITTTGPLDVATVLPNKNMYANQRLVQDYHILHVFEKYFFISKEEYNNEKASLPNSPANRNYDAYILQEAIDPNTRNKLQINNVDVNILCMLETSDGDTKFTFDGGPFPLVGRNHRIIDLNGRAYIEYNKSQFTEKVRAHAAHPTVRRSPSRRYSPTKFGMPNLLTINELNKQYIINDIDNYQHQNPITQIRSELHRTYVEFRGSPFKPNIYEKLTFYTINDRLFCTIKGKEDVWGLNEVKKYTTQNNFDTFIITTVDPNTTDRKGNQVYLLNENNPNGISIVDDTDYVIKTTSTNNIDNIEFRQWVENGTDSAIKRQLNLYASAAAAP
jgi:hypothetical protein